MYVCVCVCVCARARSYVRVYLLHNIVMSEPVLMLTFCARCFVKWITASVSMRIKCVICLVSALSRRVGDSEIAVTISINPGSIINQKPRDPVINPR